MEIRKTVLWSILESQRRRSVDVHAEAIDKTIDDIKYRDEQYLRETSDDD